MQSLSRRNLIVTTGSLVATALGVFAVIAPLLGKPPAAKAQSQSTLQPPPVIDNGSGAPEAPAAGNPAPAATPTAPAAVPGSVVAVPIPDGGGSLTTSLGGSDIAVSSVGGSYEVDGPKRRKNRNPGRPDRP